ncbi:MAG: heavy metal-responsive transcriptional regulator [Candidatus Omnitrophica bacterium]|nr:heavy metal-responsive transcriptional regulator [Candidatus Omnitrophota bacterium]
MGNEQEWTIGKLAKTAGLDARTLRFYEGIRLLPKPKRTLSGYRLYDPSMVERVEFIQKGQSLGLTLREIREILELGDRGNCPCGHVKRVLQAKLKELDRKIKDFSYVNRRIRKAMNLRGLPKDFKPKGSALCPTIARVKKLDKKSP